MSEDVLIPEIVASSALEAQDRAQIDVQIATAKKYPRVVKVAQRSMMEMATMDPDTAESCFYGLKRKDKDGNPVIISGPSVRLAEIIAVCWGNMRAGARVIDNDGRFVTAQGVAFDVQNNIAITMETKRRITNNKGKSFGDDMQAVTGNAGAAIAFRNAVLKVVPKSVWNPVYEAARKTAVGDAKTLPQRRAAAVDWFKKLGVDLDKILKYLSKEKFDEIGLEELERLQELRTAIKDGDTTIDETFNPAPTTATGPERGTLNVDELKPAADQTVRSQSEAAAEQAATESRPAPQPAATAEPAGAEPPWDDNQQPAAPPPAQESEPKSAPVPAPATQPAAAPSRPKPLVFGRKGGN